MASMHKDRTTIGFDILVGDVMTRELLSIQKLENIMSAAKILAEKNISGLPVVDRDGRVIGIITQADILSMIGMRRDHTMKDLLKHMLGEPLPERKCGEIVADIMVSPAITIRPDANISEAARILDDKRIRRLPVVDENGMLVGIITRADILKVVIRQLAP